MFLKSIHGFFPVCCLWYQSPDICFKRVISHMTPAAQLIGSQNLNSVQLSQDGSMQLLFFTPGPTDTETAIKMNGNANGWLSKGITEPLDNIAILESLCCLFLAAFVSLLTVFVFMGGFIN